MLLGFFFLLLFPSFLRVSLGLGLVRLLDLGLTLGLPLLGCVLLAARFLGRLLLPLPLGFLHLGELRLLDGLGPLFLQFFFEFELALSLLLVLLSLADFLLFHLT